MHIQVADLASTPSVVAVAVAAAVFGLGITWGWATFEWPKLSVGSR